MHPYFTVRYHTKYMYEVHEGNRFVNLALSVLFLLIPFQRAGWFFFSWQGAHIERAEVQVLHVEDPENVWVRRLQDKSYFFQLDEEIQEYCRYRVHKDLCVPCWNFLTIYGG